MATIVLQRDVFKALGRALVKLEFGRGIAHKKLGPGKRQRIAAHGHRSVRQQMNPHG